MASERWQTYLELITPRSGRMIADDGSFFNKATWLKFQQKYDPKWQTVQNGAARLSGRRRAINQTEYWIGINVPAGRNLIVWEDALKLSENEYDIDIFEAPDGFTGGTPGVKSDLGLSDSGSVQSSLSFDVTPVDDGTHVIRLEDYTDAGSIAGPGRPTIAPAGDRTFQIIDAPLLIRLTRQGTGQAFTLSYRAVVWEEPA